MEKVFDGINYKLLIPKLKMYGYTGSFFSWFYSFVSDRIQNV